MRFVKSRMRESRTSGSLEGRILQKVRLLDPAKNKLKFPSGRIRAITNRLLNNYIEFVFGGVKWK